MEATSLPSHPRALAPRSRRLLSALGDGRLVDQVRAGNDAAFEVVYDRHHGGVLAFCRHMLGSQEEAEDAVQQTFISAYDSLRRTNRAIALRPWLFTIARNRCLSVLRARREHATAEVELSTAGLAEDVERRGELRELLADVAELPEEQRGALVLSELGDLSHADIAQVLGCEAAKVKSLVFQARSALIESRRARETPCDEIREQLATLRGGALRRGTLRRHVKACPGCSEYRDDVRRQRAMMAAVLPVIPSVGLRDSALAAVGLGAGGSGGAAAAGGLGALLSSGAAKVAVVAAVAGGTAGGLAATDQVSLPVVGGSESAPAGAASEAPAGRAPAAQGLVTGLERRPLRDQGERTRRGGEGSSDHRGFTPLRGGSSGDSARDFALTRGQGKKLGLHKQHVRRRRARPVVPPPREPVTRAPRQETAPAPTTTAPEAEPVAPKTLSPEAVRPAPHGRQVP